MNKYKRNKHGFTLVELIVVLVILAILAAILVPALTGYIDKAREKTAISQCRACVQAAQTLASERHTSSSPLSLADADQILTLAEVKGQGEITTLTINKDSSAVDKLVWKAANGIVVTYENKQYVIGKASGLAGSNLALSDLISNMATTLTAANPTFSPQSVVDSTSPNGQKKTALLNNPDIKSILESANATSWKLAEKGVCLYLSDQDITQYNPGDYVRILRYNSNLKTYTAGYMKIEKYTDNSVGGTGETYNIFSSTFSANGSNATWSEAPGQDSSTKASYDEALKIYNTMSETKSK